MKKIQFFVLVSIIGLILGCGNRVPSGSPTDSSDEALVLSAFDYQGDIVQKFIIPRVEDGTKEYLKFLAKKLQVVGGEEKVQIVEQIELFEKIQDVFPKYKKRWNDADNEIIERKEAPEDEVKSFIDMRLLKLFRNVKDAFNQDFILLDKKFDSKIDTEENSTKKSELRNEKAAADKEIVKKIAAEFTPKANEFVKKLGFTKTLFSIEDISSKSFRPSISNIDKLPYEVLSKFRKIKTYLKFPKFTKENEDYSVIMDSRTVESLVFQIDEKWYMAYFHSNDIFSNYDIMNVLSDPLVFIKHDFDTGIKTVEESAKIAGKLHFLDNLLQRNYNIKLNEDTITLNLMLAKWQYNIDEKEFMNDNERFEFLRNNIDTLESCEVTIKNTELKKITAEVDISIKYKTIEENDGKTEKTFDSKDKNEKAKDDKKVDTAKYILADKTMYRRVFLNLIDNEWRIIKTVVGSGNEND